MKKFLFVFAIFFLIFSAFVLTANAEKIMKDKDGNIHKLDQELSELTPEEREAYKNPGTKVPVISTTEYKRTSFFFYTPIEKYEKVIVFQNGKLDTITKTGEKYGEPTLAIHVICLIIAIILMVIMNIAVYKCVDVFAGAFVFAGVFVFAGAFVFAGVFAGVVAGAVAGVVTGANMTKIEKRIYGVSSIISYISAMVVMLYEYI